MNGRMTGSLFCITIRAMAVCRVMSQATAFD